MIPFGHQGGPPQVQQVNGAQNQEYDHGVMPRAGLTITGSELCCLVVDALDDISHVLVRTEEVGDATPIDEIHVCFRVLRANEKTLKVVPEFARM